MTATVNLVAKSADCAIAAGNNISTIEIVEACANTLHFLLEKC